MDLYLGKPTAFQVMLKPIGPMCNLNCSYCYYLEKEKLYKGTKDWKIPDNAMEEFVRQNIQSHEVPVVQFVFQGGEPSMLNTDYYRNILKIQDKYKGNKRIENILQTNGTLLNDDWCRFLKENNFLVGISIDGPEEIHNKYRKYKNGEGSFAKVMQTIEKLNKFGVEYNTMTVVNDHNAKYPLDVYNFMKSIGSHYMQFIPIVERVSEDLPESDLHLVQPSFKGDAFVSEWSVSPGDYSSFLIKIFDEWVRNDVGQYFVQIFDCALANWYGERAGLCVFNETCGEASCLEHNGDLYSCDHFVYPDKKLGNILEQPLEQMMKSEKQFKFGLAKRDTLTLQCLDCEYRFACHGGCPKNRISKTESGEEGLNYLCSDYKAFFKYVHPYMQFMADELKSKRPPANVMSWVKKMDTRKALKGEGGVTSTFVNKQLDPTKNKIGRNDKCPCGSGRKYKQCCGKLLG
jgi:uncharacterized protein